MTTARRQTPTSQSIPWPEPAPHVQVAAPHVPRRFTRSRSDKLVAGVAGGLARYFNIDVRLTRVLTIVLCFTGAGSAAYLLLWIATPLE